MTAARPAVARASRRRAFRLPSGINIEGEIVDITAPYGSLRGVLFSARPSGKWAAGLRTGFFPAPYPQALVWIRKAAEQGLAPAQFSLGILRVGVTLLASCSASMP